MNGEIMRSFILLSVSLGLILLTTGCASKREQSEWEQYRAKKGQDELTSEIQKK
jgi:hypothetical protein